MKVLFCNSYFFLLMTFTQNVVVSYRKSTVKNAQDLQEALNTAFPGDTIHLQASIFKGQFVASQSGTRESRITVMTDQNFPESVKIIGHGTNKAALNITGNFWTFANFTLSNRHSLGLLIAGNDNIVQNLGISGVAKGVRIKGDRNQLQNCVITNTTLGVFVQAGDQNSIVNNVIVGADPCICGMKGTCCGSIRGNLCSGKIIVDGTNYTFQ